MAKYRIELSAFVTKMMTRTYTVTAKNDIEAIEKAKDRFYKACENAPTYTDCDEITVDDIRAKY